MGYKLTEPELSAIAGTLHRISTTEGPLRQLDRIMLGIYSERLRLLTRNGPSPAQLPHQPAQVSAA